jgi:hypothetical protein
MWTRTSIPSYDPGPLQNLLTTIENDQPLKYGECLKSVENSMDILKTTMISSTARMAIKNKLESLADLAAEKRKFEAKPFPRISKFFHKLGQWLIYGHGFQTKREYGLQLAHKLDEIEQSIWKQELENYIRGKKQHTDFKTMMDKIRKIPPDQFGEFKRIYVGVPGMNLGEHKKLEIFKNLTANQQQEIRTIRRDTMINWYLPASRIVEGATEQEIDEFISDSMINDFIAFPHGLMSSWSFARGRGREPAFEDFAKVVVVRGVRQCLKENNREVITRLANDYEFGKDIQAILKNKLTKDEMNMIR